MIVIDNRGTNAGSLSQLSKNPTWEQVVNLFKLKIREDLGWGATPSGQACWRFVGVSLQEGPTVYQVQVKSSIGLLVGGILALRHYSTAPDFQSAINPPYYPNGLAVFTREDGDKFGLAEFTYAMSSIVGPDGGPDSFWISASPNGQQPQYSDLVSGFGWLGGTNHLNPSPIFQYQVRDYGPDHQEDDPEPVPPVAVTGHYLLANVNAAGERIGWIPFIDGPIPTGTGARLVIMLDGKEVGYQEWQK